MQQQSLDILQQQKLLMTPYLHRIIEILQLPLIDLEQRIYDELAENPMLEAEVEAVKDSTDKFDDVELTREEDLIKYFEDTSDVGYYTSYQYDGEKEKKHNIIEEVLTRPPTLQEHLIWQLRLNTFSEEDFKIGERIISNTDNRGYLITPIEEIAKGMSLPVEKVKAVLKIIQTFEPYGVGARDLRECLMIQLKFFPEKDPWASVIVEKYFDLLSKHNFAAIAKKLGVPLNVVENSIKIIKKLNPYPGEEYDSRKTEYVVPDVMVEKVQGKYIIILNDEWIPKLRINQRYKAMLKSKNVSNKIKKYLREKFIQAVWFLKSIEQRRTTIYKVTEAILAMQYEFFEKGPQEIKPLILKDIADRIGVHESTVSRVTSNKYIQTPWGVYELKYFFSSSLKTTEDKEDVSSKKVMDMIKNIVAAEDKQKPYSDEQIADILKKKGIVISRRTVTKYRKKLKILPSNLRREK